MILSGRALGLISLLVLAAAALPGPAPAQTPDSLPQPGALKKMSLEELMAIEVSSVSRRPERLSEAASAIQVITREDIRRSGATRLPEALRLAANLQVAQLDAAQWSISARGFNSPLANKLLVLIDGRSVYSPLFAGVFWDAQDLMLEDIEQIEVISGPGATQWGANAVNGVINITTRKARDTQGLLLLGTGGTELHGKAGARYGVSLGPNARFRVYGQYADRDGTAGPDGNPAENDWTMGQGGFRVGWDASPADHVAFQGDLYEDRVHIAAGSELFHRNVNLLSRWSHRISERSDLRVQAYFDRARREVLPQERDLLETLDLDLQHRIALGERQDIVWGVAYRQVWDDFATLALPPDLQQTALTTVSAFAQDEIALVPGRLHLTLGTKLEHNEYTDFELQPSLRLAWNAAERQTVWAAVSRAVRTPSRLDRDFLPGDFRAEKLVAYELGYRVQAAERLSLSLAAFYHDYGDIRSLEISPSPQFANGQEGESYGIEAATRYQVTDRWRLQAGLTELRVEIRPKAGSTDSTFGRGEAADSRHHLFLRSFLDLPRNFRLDAAFRYISRITNPDVTAPGYGELDLRVAWQALPKLELSITGQNLLHEHHVEFGTPGQGRTIERGLYTKARWGL